MNAMDFMSRCKAAKASRWACPYFVVAFPAAAVLPSWVGWEDGPVEILQDIVLLIGAIYCMMLFRRASGRYRHGLWLAASTYFLILLGRELSWGRVFLPNGMTDYGPEFVSMHALPYYKVVYGVIAVAILWTVLSFALYMPWRRIFEEIPVPILALVLIAAAAIVAMLGDKGLLLGDTFDETLEEEMELLVYLLNIYLAHWYYRGLECADGVHLLKMNEQSNFRIR